LDKIDADQLQRKEDEHQKDKNNLPLEAVKKFTSI